MAQGEPAIVADRLDTARQRDGALPRPVRSRGGTRAARDRRRDDPAGQPLSMSHWRTTRERTASESGSRSTTSRVPSSRAPWMTSHATSSASSASASASARARSAVRASASAMPGPSSRLEHGKHAVPHPRPARSGRRRCAGRRRPARPRAPRPVRRTARRSSSGRRNGPARARHPGQAAGARAAGEAEQHGLGLVVERVTEQHHLGAVVARRTEQRAVAGVARRGLGTVARLDHRHLHDGHRIEAGVAQPRGRARGRLGGACLQPVVDDDRARAVAHRTGRVARARGSPRRRSTRRARGRRGRGRTARPARPGVRRSPGGRCRRARTRPSGQQVGDDAGAPRGRVEHLVAGGEGLGRGPHPVEAVAAHGARPRARRTSGPRCTAASWRRGRAGDGRGRRPLRGRRGASRSGHGSARRSARSRGRRRPSRGPRGPRAGS